MAEVEYSNLDIMRFDDRGDRIGWSSLQVSSSSQLAPYKIHGCFDSGEEVWCSIMVYNDGVALIGAHRPPEFEAESAVTISHKKAFLLYPNKAAARGAGWDV